jgi:hypothetical protein
MATIPSFIQEVHGVLAYEPEALELDNPWDGPGPYTYSKTWPKLPEDFRCELIEGHIIYQSPRYDLMKIDLKEVWRRFHLRGKKP